MTKERYLILLLLLFGMTSELLAGKYNPTIDIGETVSVWEALPGVDGRAHAWAEYKEAKVFVVAFTCNTCPYATDYESRLKELAARWQDDARIALVAINSNSNAEDSLEAMTEKAKSAKFNFPYLKDEKQELGKAWGATRTPEFFVLDDQQRVVYMGALDDNTDAEKATVNYVNAAIEATLAGKTPKVQETVPIGCNIRYRRRRR